MFRPRECGPVVLLYHNVEETTCPLVRKLGLTIKPAHFEEHMRWLTREFQVVPLEKLDEHRDNPRAAAVTFDDGFCSVLTAALPVLERYRCPAKVFLNGANLHGINWTNKLSFLLCTLPVPQQTELAAEAVDLPSGFRGPVTIFHFIDAFEPGKTPAAIDHWFARAHPEPPRKLYLDETETRILALHPLIRLGSHTRNHYPLIRLSREQLHDEVVGNHAELEHLFHGRVEGFCVPFGFRSHLTRDVVAAVRLVDHWVLSACGGCMDRSTLFGMPEVKRCGVWGENLGVLWYQLTHNR